MKFMQLFSFISTSVKLETRNPLSVKNFFEPASFKNKWIKIWSKLHFILFCYINFFDAEIQTIISINIRQIKEI